MDTTYIGWFVDKEQLDEQLEKEFSRRLEQPVPCPCVVLAYAPSEPPTALYGSRADIRAIGYGCDGRTEALLVTVDPHDCSLCRWLRELPGPGPCLTLSTAAGANPAEPAHLGFQPIEPFSLTGIFGACLADGRRVTAAPDQEQPPKEVQL